MKFRKSDAVYYMRKKLFSSVDIIKSIEYLIKERITVAFEMKRDIDIFAVDNILCRIESNKIVFNL